VTLDSCVINVTIEAKVTLSISLMRLLTLRFGR
jgi:hypothetical protein